METWLRKRYGKLVSRLILFCFQQLFPLLFLLLRFAMERCWRMWDHRSPPWHRRSVFSYFLFKLDLLFLIKSSYHIPMKLLISLQVGEVGRKGWNSLNGTNSSFGHEGYNSPASEQFDGFSSNNSGQDGYQQPPRSNSKSSPVSNDSANGVGGGWADWDDVKNNGQTASSS